MDFQNAPLLVAPIGDGFKVTFDGPIHTNVAWIEREMDKIIAAKPKRVELDLSRTTYISSLGLGVLVSLHNRINASGGKVYVVSIKKRTVGILKMAYLDKLLTITPDAVLPD